MQQAERLFGAMIDLALMLPAHRPQYAQSGYQAGQPYSLPIALSARGSLHRFQINL